MANNVARKYKQPELISVDGKIKNSRVGWNHANAASHLIAHPGKFITVDEWCRIFYGRVTVDNKARVRRNFTALFKHLLHNHHLILVVEPINSRGMAGACKLLDNGSFSETRLVSVKAEKMRARKELNEVEYQLVLQLSKPENE